MVRVLDLQALGVLLVVVLFGVLCCVVFVLCCNVFDCVVL